MASVMGIGSDNIIKIETDDNGRMITDKLEIKIIDLLEKKYWNTNG